MNADYQYPDLVTKFLALPIKRAKLVTLYALQSEEGFIKQLNSIESSAHWYNTLEKLYEDVDYQGNAWDNRELLRIVSEFEDDPSIKLNDVGFDEEESQGADPSMLRPQK